MQPIFRLKAVFILLTALFWIGCDSLPRPVQKPNRIKPLRITEMVQYDTDDPAIWIHPTAPESTLIIGTDKDTDGALAVFDIEGKILEDRTVRGLKRPNNVDVEYGFQYGKNHIDIAVVTEREANQLRVFRLPNMTPIDGGGLPVFVGEKNRSPMGIALYKRPRDGQIFAILSRKHGPVDGEYLWQYHLETKQNTVTASHIRSFGRFSGSGEIEAIAVDDKLGFVYYSDENTGIRKYGADPDGKYGNQELALFGQEGFKEDREGISIYCKEDSSGHILVSDQQADLFQVFPREGLPNNPHAHPRIASIALSTRESDGSEVLSDSLNSQYPAGLFVAMSDDRTFHLYDWRDLQHVIDSAGF